MRLSGLILSIQVSADFDEVAFQRDYGRAPAIHEIEQAIITAVHQAIGRYHFESTYALRHLQAMRNSVPKVIGRIAPTQTTVRMTVPRRWRDILSGYPESAAEPLRRECVEQTDRGLTVRLEFFVTLAGRPTFQCTATKGIGQYSVLAVPSGPPDELGDRVDLRFDDGHEVRVDIDLA